MKLHTASFTLLCLVLAAVAARAQTLYENGPINGTVDAWTINFGYIVSDTFVATPGQIMSGFAIGVWEFPGDSLSSLQWSVTSAENGGTVYGSGVATAVLGVPGGGTLVDKFNSMNEYGYNIDTVTVTGLAVTLGGPSSPAGMTYWLNLQNATVPSGDPVYWDENSGVGCGSPGCPSQASESALGTIPSEAFTISGGGTGTVPEPNSVMLFGSGILGLAGLLRRRLL